MPTDYEFGKYYLVLDKKVNRHIQSNDNPHKVTKAQVGLDQVANLSPDNMPLSIAAKEEIARLDERIDRIALYSNSYEQLTKLTEYLYQAEYSLLDYEYAVDVLNNSNEALINWCAGMKVGNYFARNLDAYYDESASFLIRTPNAATRYAVAGTTSGVRLLTNEYVDSRQVNTQYKILPFLLLDGINEKGVFAAIQTTTKQSTPVLTVLPEEEVTAEYSALMIVRYILDNFDNAEEAVEHIKKHIKIIIPNDMLLRGFECQWIVGDKNKTFAISLDRQNQPVIVTEITDNPVITNFSYKGLYLGLEGGDSQKVYTPATQDLSKAWDAHRYNQIDVFGFGLERFNKLVDSYRLLSAKTKLTVADIQEELAKIFYTKVYTLDNIEHPEEFFFTDYTDNYNGAFDIDNVLQVNSKPADFADKITYYKNKYNERSRATADTRQTVLCVVYDFRQNKVYLQCQEDTSKTFVRNIQDDFQHQIDELKEEIIPGEIEKEATARQEADEALHQEILDEKERAESAESDLHDEIVAETERAELAESGLAGDIASEAQTRLLEDSRLERKINDDIQTERQRALDAESALGGRIDDIEDDLDDEIDRAEAAEQDLQDQINALDLSTVGSDGGYIKTIAQEDGQVSASRQAFDTTLENADNKNAPTSKTVKDYVDAETDRATRIEAGLREDLETEQSTRSSADNDLQAQIDAIEARSDVVDVVNTLADLQRYDTSKLSDKDIVKVLTDSSHDNTTSYYRWNIKELPEVSSWEYVGSVEAYYTKAETDDKFVPYTGATKAVNLGFNTLTSGDVTIRDTSGEHLFTFASSSTKWNLSTDRILDFITAVEIKFSTANSKLTLAGNGSSIDLTGANTSVKLTGSDSELLLSDNDADIKFAGTGNKIKNAAGDAVYTFNQGADEYVSGLTIKWSTTDGKNVIYQNHVVTDSSANVVSRLLASNKFVLSTVTTGYQYTTPIESGDEVLDAGLQNALSKHLPATVNNVLLHYQGTKAIVDPQTSQPQTVVEYVNILETNGKTNIVLYEYNISTHILTFNTYESQDVGFIIIPSNVTGVVLTPEQQLAVQKTICFVKLGDDTLSKTANTLNEYVFTSLRVGDDTNYKLYAVELRVDKVAYTLTKTENTYVWYSKAKSDELLATKQEVLIDDNTSQNQNLKTINQQSLLGQGDMHITEGAILTRGSDLEDGNYDAGQLYYCTSSSESFTAGCAYLATGVNSIVKLSSTNVSVTPDIVSFSISPTSTEYGNAVACTYSYTLKKPTLLRDLKLDSVVIEASPSSTSGSGTASTAYDSHTFTLSATGAEHSRTASISPVYRHFAGVMSGSTVSEILANLKNVTSSSGNLTTYLQNSIPSSYTGDVGSTATYIYFIVKGTISSVKSGGFDVPVELLQSSASFTNSFDASYNVNVYRTVNKVIGVLNFNIN